jgi:hypothetical protein
MLLEMARGRPCLLCITDVCMGRVETVVACHSNLAIHGKGGARKADDHYSVWGCMSCHRWLDQGPATADEKALAFTLAHVDQMNEWRRIAADPSEPERVRRAAGWALEQLKNRSA